MYQNLAVFAAFLLVYSIFAGRFESRLLNGPAMFMLAGLLLGPAALGLLHLDVTKEAIKLQAVDDILPLEAIARAILQFDARA